jgi:hypothetical protein
VATLASPLAPGVDLIVNTFERTYRDVLRSGTLERIAEDNRFPFARRVALVNNVDDPEHVRELARPLLRSGEIDELRFVADELPAAMRTTRITERDLGRVRHYTDCAISAIALPGSPWLLYWDADVRLERPFDWISPSIELMEADPAVVVANPNWTPPILDQVTIERRGEFAIGRGFSDQLFLVRRAEFARPIYHQRCIARLRYPIAHIGYVFEARVDAWMRHADRVRATHTGVRYLHPAEEAGATHPAAGPVERVRKARNELVVAALARSPWLPECCRYMYL